MHLHLDINRAFFSFSFLFLLFLQTEKYCCSTVVWDDKEYIDLKVDGGTRVQVAAQTGTDDGRMGDEH